MADVSIKNLPEASQINLNDFLIVEGETGTNILKFSNFIIAQENTNFQPLLSSHTDSIDFNRTLLTDLSSSTLSLSSFFDSTSRGLALGGDVLHTLSGIGIGTTDVAEKLTVLGNISASGSLSAIGNDYSYFKSNVSIGGSTGPVSRLTVTGNSDAGEGDCRIDIIDNDSTGGSSIPAISFRSGISTQIYQIRANDALGLTFRDSSDATKVVFDKSGRIGIGTNTPHTTLHIGGSGSFSMAEATEHPVDPAANTEAYFYVKADKFIIKFNDSGTIRYKYMVLSGDDMTWVQTLTSP